MSKDKTRCIIPPPLTSFKKELKYLSAFPRSVRILPCFADQSKCFSSLIFDVVMVCVYSLSIGSSGRDGSMVDRRACGVFELGVGVDVAWCRARS